MGIIIFRAEQYYGDAGLLGVGIE